MLNILFHLGFYFIFKKCMKLSRLLQIMYKSILKKNEVVVGYLFLKFDRTKKKKIQETSTLVNSCLLSEVHQDVKCQSHQTGSCQSCHAGSSFGVGAFVVSFISGHHEDHCGQKEYEEKLFHHFDLKFKYTLDLGILNHILSIYLCPFL